MAGNFSGGSFSGAVGGFSVDGGTPPVPEQAFMLHGGGASRSKKDRTLREQIVALFERASEIPALAVAVQRIVEPHVSTETKTRIRVDWRDLRKDLDAIRSLLALAERAYSMALDDDDEDDVEILLIH